MGIAAAEVNFHLTQYVYVYNRHVKGRDLEHAFRRLGWTFPRHGSWHDVWTDGEREEAIPRHIEITKGSPALFSNEPESEGKVSHAILWQRV